MKTASTGLKALLASTYLLIYADLWTFSLKNGANLYYTSWDTDLTVGGQLFKSHDVLVNGGKFKQIRGLEVNETDVTCLPSLGSPTPASLVGQVPFLIAVRTGLFDRATALRQRIFMPTPGDTSLGAVTLFLGEVTDTDATRNTATLKCKDATNLLNIYMPRRQYQPTCSFTFGDSNCTFNKASLTVAAQVGAGSGGNVIMAPLSQVAGYFNNGTVKFTSGVNAGISRAIGSYNPGAVTLTGPFPLQPAVGDNFTITPGCSKNFAGPTQSFTGATTTGISPSVIYNFLTQPAGTFNGYYIGFNDGPLVNQVRVISSYIPGQITLVRPFPEAPNVNDEFTISTNPEVFGFPQAISQTQQIVSGVIIPTNLPMADGFFNNGLMQFTSGQNVGQERTVISFSQGIATLSSPLPYPPAQGDEFTISTQAQGAPSTCAGYNNTVNFGGQDTVPIPETAY